MFKKDKIKCSRCKSNIKESFDFCPYCGLDLGYSEKNMKDFGVLGKNEFMEGAPMKEGLGGFGITDKMINSIFNSLMKNLNGQMKDIDFGKKGADVENIPNGIRINFGLPAQKQVQKKAPVRGGVTRDQIKRMGGLPRVEAKTDIRRLSDKVIYELKAPGIENVEDIFVSKLEKGYEVKAIGKKKVYVNSLPIDLPLKGYSITKQGLNVEFGLN